MRAFQPVEDGTVWWSVVWPRGRGCSAHHGASADTAGQHLKFACLYILLSC